MAIDIDGVVGVLLAGGQSRRMGGGDKSLKCLGGRPILEHVLERVRGQVGRLVLNANGDPERFAQYGLPVAEDVVEGQPGPLAGVLTGMTWAQRNAPNARWILTVATDAPFVPTDLVARLGEAIERDNADLGCASSGGRHHPVIGLWPVAFADALKSAIETDGIRKVDRWTAGHRLAVIDYPDQPVDPFFNVNRPEDMKEAEILYKNYFI
tara:strand:- start:3656 stop:4285 length:630 start_codon:yes stop_codon:yes gene_type:complete